MIKEIERVQTQKFAMLSFVFAAQLARLQAKLDGMEFDPSEGISIEREYAAKTRLSNVSLFFVGIMQLFYIGRIFMVL
jgi:hypothetical protein